jgi:glycosyltransferase involved in cell wall biosynthesis
MQGAQAGGRIRGVGRYTRNLTEAMVRQAGGHEILLALNGSFPATIEPLRAAFAGLLPPEAIAVWSAPGPTSFDEPSNAWRLGVAERLRETFIAGLAADIVHISAVFEGYADAAVTGFGPAADVPPAGVMLYDLTPLLMPETYLIHDGVASWYRQKLQV